MNTCEMCGKSYEPTRAQQKYCSRECYHKRPVWNKGTKGLQVAWNKSEWTSLKCEHCNKEYSVVPSQAKKSRFCSRLCQNRWLAANKKRLGPDNGMYVTGNSPKHYRREAFRIYGEKCNRCGELEFKKLLVHHIDENRHNNPLDGSNWEVLCKRCHQLHHDCTNKLPKEPRPKKLYKLKCKSCKSEFTNVRQDAKFCSRRCHYDFKIIHIKREKICLQCSSPYTAKKETQRFCSSSCSNKYRASIS